MTYRCCDLCQPWSRGTGTKMTIAFLPWPTSICKSPGVSKMPPSAQRLFNREFYFQCIRAIKLQPECPTLFSDWGSSPYLAGRHELQRPQGTAHVWDVGLELVQRICDAGLDLRGVLARRAVAGDFVKSGGHGEGCAVDVRWCRRKVGCLTSRCSKVFW